MERPGRSLRWFYLCRPLYIPHAVRSLSIGLTALLLKLTCPRQTQICRPSGVETGIVLRNVGIPKDQRHTVHLTKVQTLRGPATCRVFSSEPVPTACPWRAKVGRPLGLGMCTLTSLPAQTGAGGIYCPPSAGLASENYLTP